MAKILCIDTATTNCSVALFEDEKLLGCFEKNESMIHASQLHVFIKELFESTGTEMSSLSAVAVSKGPGSYTGLRIGVSSAKGICFSLDIPLISLPTLYVMASKMKTEAKPSDKPILFCPAIDARRMEIYTAFYDENLNEVKPVSADIIDADSYKEYFEKYFMCFAGDGALKCREVFSSHKDAGFTPDFYPSAMDLGALALEKFNKGDFENLVTFEPFYLKEFMATTPRTGKV